MFDGWKKYGSTRSHPTFLQFQLSKKNTSDHPIASKSKVQEILQFSWCFNQTSLVIQKNTRFAKV